MKKYIIFIVVLFFSCSNYDLHHKEFIRYMREVFKTEIDNNKFTKIYYPIHMQGCHGCLRRNIELLLSLHVDEKVLTPILIGKYRKKTLKDKILKLKSKYNCITDSKQKIFSYRTNFAKPLLVHIKNGRIIYYKEIVDNLLPEANSYFQKLDSSRDK